MHSTPILLAWSFSLNEYILHRIAATYSSFIVSDLYNLYRESSLHISEGYAFSVILENSTTSLKNE